MSKEKKIQTEESGSGSDLKRVLGYAENMKGMCVVSWLLSMLSSLLSLVPYWCIWQIFKNVMDEKGDLSRASLYGWTAVIFAVLSALFYILSLMLSYKSALKASSNMKKRLLRFILAMPLGSVTASGSGKLRKIVNDFGEAIEKYLSQYMPNRISTIAMALGLIFLLLFYNWKLGILSLVSMILGIVLLMVFMGRGLKEKMKEYQNSLDKMSNDTVEYVRGISVIKTFGQSVFYFRRLRDTIDSYSRFAVDYMKAMRLPMVLCITAIYSVFAFLIFGSACMTADGVENGFIIDLIFYVILTPAIAIMMNKFMYQSKDAIVLSDAFERVDKILSMQPVTWGHEIVPEKDHSIRLDNVYFSYDGKTPALNGVSLNIESGSTAALVGHSGSGKTTIANLVTRFYDTDKGSIFIGGRDIKSMQEKDFMDKISFVLQDSKLIKASIADNVLIGRKDASRDEVMEALEKAQCRDIIEKFPDGVDTIIGSEGVYLSGGEMQRIAIARTILKNSPIIILDEATAFADPDNESRIQAALNELMRNKTVIMIAHRLSTITNADVIFVMDEGKLVEYGSFNELLANKGIFSKMWDEYNSAVDLELSSGHKKKGE